jgi:tRNA (guanine26-N2/guanine27-N2)-dimethyltransferase
VRPRREGATDFLGPETTPGRGPRPRAAVFYNPAMATDRDLGVAFVRAWAGEGGLSGWETTAATGIRGLRLIGETDAFRSFLFTEANPAAFAVLERNVVGRTGARAVLADGRAAAERSTFDWVDVDPFGSPIPFVRAALDAVRPGGVVATTATDMIVLAGAQSAATWRKYGARAVRGRLGPEAGLRILLAFLAREARTAGRSIVPRLAYALDHHVRAYVEVIAASARPDPVGSIDPATWDGPPLGPTGPFGPMWLGPILDPEIAGRMQVPATAERPTEVAGFLERIREEAAVPAPFYYEPNVLAGRLGLATPPSIGALRAALGERGYRSARTHARPEGIRTDAPRAIVESVARDLGSNA